MSESAGRSEEVEEPEEQREPRKKRPLPPGSLDVIYSGGFPPFWKIWKKRMMTIPPPERPDSGSRGVSPIARPTSNPLSHHSLVAVAAVTELSGASEVECCEEPGMARAAMLESTNGAGEVAEEAQAAPRKWGERELPPIVLDVIYIGGFPPFWQIWRRKGGMVTIQVEPRESRPQR